MPRTSKVDAPFGSRLSPHPDEDENGSLQALFETLQALRTGDFSARRPRGRLTAEIGAVLDSIEAMMEAEGRLKRPPLVAGEQRPRPRTPRQTNRQLARKVQRLAERNAELERHLAEKTAALEQARAELERAREHAAASTQAHEKQRMESLGRFAGSMVHDFNNVLMAILGYLDLIALNLADDASMRRPIDGAIQAAERGTMMTRRMLALARRQEPRPETVDIVRRIDGLRAMLRRSLGPRIELDLAFEEGLAAARVDPGQFDLALLDLALNARDAMPEGGRLTIAVRRVAAAIGQVPALTAGDYVLIVVADNGAGMDEATLKRAPEPFYTTKDTANATGLGLSMVSRLAAQSGGAVRLSSRLGVGTAVELWLPVAESSETRVQRTWRPSAGGPATPSIERPLPRIA